jgi:nitrite reductase (NO-forming)
LKSGNFQISIQYSNIIYTTIAMENNKTFIRFLPLFMLIALFAPTGNEVSACEACNRMFLESLKTQERAGGLVSRELLATIAAQESFRSRGESPVNERGTSDIQAGNTEIAGVLKASSNKDLSAISNPSQSFTRNESTIAEPVEATSANEEPAAQIQSESGQTEFIEIISRDSRLPIPATGYVPQNTTPDVRISITLQENDTYIGNGVIYKGFTIDNKIPGPTVIVNEGDIVEFTIVNNGNIPHGASIHAANTQTSKYLGKIYPGDSNTVVFQANMPGVYMYHCAPGGHAIPMHIIFGQYGMMVVKPRKKFELERILNKEPDIEIYLVQHEYYASGKDAVEGQGKPMYTAFNGKIFRYVEEPIVGKPGDYVRINFLNVGPNLLSTFHIVGVIWDFAYWQGNPDNKFIGGQSITAGPSDSWVVEFRIPPDEGNYLMLSHAVGSTDRGAIGLLVCDANGESPKSVLSDGPSYSEEEMAEFREKSNRTITPFGIGSGDVEIPVTYGPETDEVIVRIIGNSYYPKIVKVAPGTTIKWINEDVFTYMEGEFSGIHNVMAMDGPEKFFSPMLAHAESWSETFTTKGEYTYICTPHPYMEGKIIVTDIPAYEISSAAVGTRSKGMAPGWVLISLTLLALIIALIALINK